eukprot:COSAG05_NODE_97_length_19444_cov_8.577174_9_plen_107_part_00
MAFWTAARNYSCTESLAHGNLTNEVCGGGACVWQVHLMYEPQVFRAQTTAFMQDYTTRYPMKEYSTGVEGWLECSVDGSHFQPRFCYMQKEPFPCMKVSHSACQPP